MKSKKIILGALALAFIAASVPSAASAMNSIEKPLEVKEKSLKKVGQEKVNSIQKKIDKLQEEGGEDEEKLKKLTDEREKAEIEYDLFDYEKEIEIRINTVKTAINDMNISLERGLDEKEKKEIKKRIKALEPVVEKYETILSDESNTKDYKVLASELNDELSKIYDKINE